MIKVGDRVKSLVDWLDTKAGHIYTVESVNDKNSVRLVETSNFLIEKEYEKVIIESKGRTNTHKDEKVTVESEELENTKRYQTTSGKQLFDVLEEDLLTYEEARGFYKANIYKYTHRYKQKNGIEDLKKVKVYVEQLIKLEEKQNEI